jgi:Holliday junction DNA helicase RuvA
MIASLTGILKVKNPTEVLIEVNGVGFTVSIPLSTFERLGETTSTVTLLTYLHVREDILQLYGFSTEHERVLFKMLISVSGIGPKTAQAVLSGIAVAELQQYIVQGNVGALTSIPGIGRKTAERLVVELRDKLGKAEFSSMPPPTGESATGIRSEAMLALTSLGFSRQVAEKAIREALRGADQTTLSLEELIKKALRTTG